MIASYGEALSVVQCADGSLLKAVQHATRCQHGELQPRSSPRFPREEVPGEHLRKPGFLL